MGGVHRGDVHRRGAVLELGEEIRPTLGLLRFGRLCRRRRYGDGLGLLLFLLVGAEHGLEGVGRGGSLSALGRHGVAGRQQIGVRAVILDGWAAAEGTAGTLLGEKIAAIVTANGHGAPPKG